MPEEKDEQPRPDSDLRDHLHQMEAKVRKLRESRNGHNEQAKRFADQRNAIQAQYKEHREKVDVALAEVKAIRTEGNVHKERRILHHICRLKRILGDEFLSKFGEFLSKFCDFSAISQNFMKI